MENTETITTLKGISEKTSKAGRKYFSVETDDGTMTMFDKPIIDEMMKHVGKKVRLEIVESSGFKNIKKFCGEVTEEKISNAAPTAKPEPAENFEAARKLKDQSIYTSYAKDVCIAIMQAQGENKTSASINAIMATAIDVVKQARDAFQ